MRSATLMRGVTVGVAVSLTFAAAAGAQRSALREVKEWGVAGFSGAMAVPLGEFSQHVNPLAGGGSAFLTVFVDPLGLLAMRFEGSVLAYSHNNVTDPASEEAASAWWEEMTAAGGEGMVVKPMPFVASGTRGLVQPAVKCRGREYLRIIYGPEYTLAENLTRLRQRGLHAKRSLALREFALGIEALERFVRHEPLRRVHECVFGVLALESEPVDPRLRGDLPYWPNVRPRVP